MDGEALTIKEAADRLHLSKCSVQRLITKGELPCRRYGPGRRLIRIDAADVAKYWESCKGAEKPPAEGKEEVRMASRHLRPPSPSRPRA